jgi:hypothetical protein
MSQPSIPEAQASELTPGATEPRQQTAAGAVRSTHRRKASRKFSVSGRTMAAAVGAVLVGVGGIVYLVMGTSSGGHSTGNGSAASAGAGGVGNPVTAGQPGSGTGTATSGSAGAQSAANAPKPLRPHDPAMVNSWNSGSGGKALKRITAQAGTVLMAHGAGQYPEMKSACAALSSAVATAQAAPALPDATMQREYQISLKAFRTGAAECRAAISQHAEGAEDTVTNVNSALIKTAVAKISTGMTDLYIATDMLRNPAKKS